MHSDVHGRAIKDQHLQTKLLFNKWHGFGPYIMSYLCQAPFNEPVDLSSGSHLVLLEGCCLVECTLTAPLCESLGDEWEDR